MLAFIQVVLFVIVLIAFVVIAMCYSQYLREGGEPSRPWFGEQSTPRLSQLSRRSKRAAVVAILAVVVLAAIDIATKS